MRQHALVGPTLLMAGAAWLCGCSGNSAKGTWQDSAANRPTFSRILIVGVSKDFTQRCSFEFSMASQFAGSSTVPVVSCNTMMPNDPLTRANIERVAAAGHADGVLTSAVVSMQFSGHQGNTSDTRATPYYQVTGEGWVTGDLGATASGGLRPAGVHTLDPDDQRRHSSRDEALRCQGCDPGLYDADAGQIERYAVDLIHHRDHHGADRDRLRRTA